MVMLPARAVGVAVVELLRGRVANLDDLHGEVQRLAGQRVVGVDRDVVLVDADDRHDARAVVRLRLELHADLDVLHAGELRAWHGLHEPGVLLPVAVLRLDRRQSGEEPRAAPESSKR